jgi:N-methylhydantoinase B
MTQQSTPAAGTFLSAEEIEGTYGIDLITAETIRGGLIEATRHMYRTLGRSAFSNVVRDLLDFGVCVHLPGDDGIELVAITEGCTHFAFTQPHMANFVMDEWGMENLGPGDTVICNDPWRGSIHMPDVNLFRGVFWEGEPILLLSDASHLIDIGGPQPGGWNNYATEFFAEGLRIPPMLITSGDKPVRSAINLILENTRTPAHNLGDLRALFGTMKIGEARVVSLLERYGGEAVLAACRYTLDLAERRTRAAIAVIPDGTYEADEWLDEDGLDPEPLKIHLSARVAGSHVELDFSGTDRQPLGSITTCWEEMNRVLIGPKMILDPRHPMNSGMFRPFHVLAPAGSVTMGVPPTSSSGHTEIAPKVAMLGANVFGQMVPERAIASDGGSSFSVVLSGIDQRPGKEGQPVGTLLIAGIGWGGTPTNDGIGFTATPIYGSRAPSPEFVERDTPIVVLSTTSAMLDAAGAGEHRAGFTGTFLVECTDGELVATVLLDSGRFPRWGIAGGGMGQTAYIFGVDDAGGDIPQANGLVPLDHLHPLAGIFNSDGVPDTVNGEWSLGTELTSTKVTAWPMPAGKGLYVTGPAGGGYGNPLDRDPNLVRKDVWNELISIQAAADSYGVVVDPETLTLDAEASNSLRGRLRKEQESGAWQVPMSGIENWPMTAADLPKTVALATEAVS